MHSVGFFRRVFALVYDSLVVAGILLSFTLLLVIFNGGYAEPGSFISFVQLLVCVCVGPFFYSYFWLVNNGQTIGMQAWKIRLVSLNNSKLNAKQTYLRCLVSTLSFVCFGIGYFWILFNKNNLSWSDIVTKTRIVKVD